MINQIVTSAPRFFGGHYDSVKQATVKDYIQRNLTHQTSVFETNHETTNILKDLYTTRMRLDILLAGDVVVTDAQYYDGAYFYALSESDFFSALSELNSNFRPFEVRRRKTGLLGIIGKPFIYSSLDNDVVKAEVKKTIEGVLLKQPSFNSVQEAFTAYVDAVDINIRPQLEQITQKIIKLEKNSPVDMFVDWNENNIYKECQEKASRDLPFKYPFGENKAADEVLLLMKSEIEGKWDRSKIWGWVNEFRQSTFVAGDKKRDDAVEQTWAWFMKLYNRSMAYQHDCNCLDVGEDMVYAYTDTKADDEYRQQIQKILSKDILEGLTIELSEEIAKENWSEFFKRINSEPIHSVLRNWREVKMTSLNLPPMAQKVQLLKELIPLVTAIRESYKTIGTEKQVIKSGTLVVGESISLIAGGALFNVVTGLGICIGGIMIPVVPILLTAAVLAGTVYGLAETVDLTVGNPIEEYNLIKIGLQSARDL